MKAKLVNESIDDVFRGKSREEILSVLLKFMGGKLPKGDLYHVIWSPSLSIPFAEGWDAGITAIMGVTYDIARAKKDMMISNYSDKAGGNFFVVSDKDYWNIVVKDEYGIDLEDYLKV